MARAPTKSATSKASAERLRTRALSYPLTHEDHPWGETAIKVGKKVFLFMNAGGEGLSMSVKLPHTGEMALVLPFAEPTGYGLGKAGWVTARFPPNERPPLDLLSAWIDESYRAVAPAKLVALISPKMARPTPQLARPRARR